MAGGLMQVVTFGTQDLTLTGNPQITFFNIIYRRYTNFGKKFIQLSFDNTTNFNSDLYIKIPKNNGDLISKTILKIKLPKIDLTYLNNKLSQFIKINDNNTSNYLANGEQYYQYCITFINKLKNIIRVFFAKYDIIGTSLSYIDDLKIYIQDYFNIDQYSQFFLSIEFFFGANTEIKNYNVDLYTNASLFKIQSNIMVYIYEQFNYQTLSYDGFKFAIEQNIAILDELNKILYDKLFNNLTTQSKIKFCWVNKIATYLINSIDFYIGSNKIYSLSDTYINNYAELYYKNNELYDSLIGNNSIINIFSETIDSTTLYLPIPFWNYSNYGLAFPLISLQYNDIQIRINTKKFIDCIRINYDQSSFNTNLNNEIINMITNNIGGIIGSSLDMSIIMEYIYLDSVERSKFARSAHEYLIEQVQEIEFNKISQSNSFLNLEIFHCCKDMFWFLQKQPTQNDIFNNDPNVFFYTYSRKFVNLNSNVKFFLNYVEMLYVAFIPFDSQTFYNGTYVIKDNVKYIEKLEIALKYYSNKYAFPSVNKNMNVIATESKFTLNSTQLFNQSWTFFNYLHPYCYYNSTPQMGLNVYSFCLKPTEFQPTGSCNMSRISYIGLNVIIADKPIDIFENLFTEPILGTTDIFKLTFQTRNFNVLRLIGGIGATAYTYNY